jgi:hypothetical protein
MDKALQRNPERLQLLKDKIKNLICLGDCVYNDSMKTKEDSILWSANFYAVLKKVEVANSNYYDYLNYYQSLINLHKKYVH